MKRILNILAISFLMTGIIACDKIDEGEYFKANNEGNDTIPLSNDDINNWQNKKTVLLEDYTGVRCVNCPNAAVIAHELQEQYANQVVVLGIHAGRMANGGDGYPDFKTEEGEKWYKDLNLSGNPVGTINRQKNGNSYGYYPPQWSEAMAEAVKGTPNIRLLSAAKYNEKDRELKVTVYSKFLEEFPDKYNLTVCLMEDNIVGKQDGKNGLGGDNYLHRHVFRRTLNGEWGTELNAEGDIIAPETEIIKNYSIKLDDKFNADNCYIISYISNRETKEILQVFEKKIK